MNASDDRPEQSVSPQALRVLAVVRSAHAVSLASAITESEIAKRARVPVRDVVDLRRELAERAGVALLGSGAGCYIEEDPVKIRSHGQRGTALRGSTTAHIVVLG